jgi:hypothetical protein
VTTVEIEQRLAALERRVARLEEWLAPCSFVVDIPPKEEFTVRGKIVSIEQGFQGLSLSEAEWASLRPSDFE